MAKNSDVLKKGQDLKEKLQYGDYTTLGNILGIAPETAKKRYIRGNKQAAEALQEIVESREKLIKKFQTQNNNYGN